MEGIYHLSEVGSKEIWLWIGGGLRRGRRIERAVKGRSAGVSRDN